MTVHGVLTVAALVLGGGAAVTDGLRPVDGARLVDEIAQQRDRVSAVTLAKWIVDGRKPHIFDLRSDAEFAAFHIPSATHATLETLLHADLPRGVPLVVYADGGARAAQAWMVLRLRGYRDVAYLREGVYEWLVRVQEPQLALDATPAERADFERRVVLSRYFGGQPHVDVQRDTLAAGYWATGEDAAHAPSLEASLLVAAIRRRGC